MQHINLADGRLLPPRRGLTGATMLALLVVACCAVALHGAVEQRRLSRVLDSGSETVAAAEAGEQQAAAADMQDLQLRIAKRRALLDSLDTAQALPADAAGSLERVLAAVPDPLWLTEVELHGARGLRIAGGALDPAALAAFAERLAQVRALRGVPIETLRMSFDAGTSPAGDGEAALQPPSHRFVIASAAAQESPR